MSSINWITRQCRMQSGFEPKGSGRVRKDFVDFRQIICFKRFVHRNTSGSTDINRLSTCSLGGPSDIICGVHGNGLWLEEMAVPATCTRHGRCQSRRCGLKFTRQGDWLSAPAVEDGADCASEGCIFPPKLHLQAPSTSIEENRTLEPWPLLVCGTCEAVPRDEQVIRAFNPQHLYAH